MAATPQNYANHARFEPLFHFVCFPLLLAYFIHATRRFLQVPDLDHFFPMILGLGLLLLAWYTRVFALTVQDRVIRLELALRVQRLAPELASRFGTLTRSQFTALRFAGDAEFAGLLREALDGKLPDGRSIKRRVQDWQADHLRA